MITPMFQHQALVFGLAIANGIIFTFAYDMCVAIEVIMLKRKSAKFWLYLAYSFVLLISVIRFTWVHNYGELRFYICVGFVIGLGIYYGLIRPVISGYIYKILIFIRIIFKKIMKIICKPLKNLCKQIRLLCERLMRSWISRRGDDKKCRNREEDQEE